MRFKRKNKRLAVCDGDAVLEVTGQAAVGCHDSPLVTENINSAVMRIYHRLNRNRHSRNESGTVTGFSLVRNLRGLRAFRVRRRDR